MGLTCAAGLAFTGFSIGLAGALKPISLTGMYLAYAGFAAYRPHKCDPRIIFIVGSTGQIVLITLFMTPLTYVAASADLPMQDAALHSIDRMLRLDWMSYFNFVYGNTALLYCATLAYAMIRWPVFAIPMVLGATRRYERLQVFTLAFGLALACTTLISIWVPAMGIYELLGFSPDPTVFRPAAYTEYLDIMPRVRDGSLRALEFAELIGLVTFPSFHAAAAVLYLWALWPIRWFGPIAAAINVAMILATPICGGHYFIDVLAGIAVAIASIFVSKAIGRWFASAKFAPQRSDLQRPLSRPVPYRNFQGTTERTSAIP